jgi:hypothetical protein
VVIERILVAGLSLTHLHVVGALTPRLLRRDRIKPLVRLPVAVGVQTIALLVGRAVVRAAWERAASEDLGHPVELDGSGVALALAGARLALGAGVPLGILEDQALAVPSPAFSDVGFFALALALTVGDWSAGADGGFFALALALA